jgi:hypothetical protein
VPKKSRRACQWTRWAQSFQCWKRQKTGLDQQVANLTQIFGKEFGDDAQKLANNLPELRRQIELTQGAAFGIHESGI